jgi:hypothetical protein
LASEAKGRAFDSRRARHNPRTARENMVHGVVAVAFLLSACAALAGGSA